MTRIRALALAAALAATGVALPASPAVAAGTSPTQYGCYAQWWNTAFAGYCYDVPRDIAVFLTAACSWQVDYAGPTIQMSAGSSDAPFDSGQCRYSVTSATTVTVWWG